MTEAIEPALAAPPLGWLPRALRQPRRPALAIAAGWALAFFPSLLLSTAAQRLFPGLPAPDFPMRGGAGLSMLVLFAPLAETLIMAGILTLLLRFLSPAAAVLLSAVGWGVAHSFAAPVWGLVIWWPFLIFSTLFVVWRERGVWVGVAVAASVHALHNLVPALLVMFGR